MPIKSKLVLSIVVVIALGAAWFMFSGLNSGESTLVLPQPSLPSLEAEGVVPTLETEVIPIVSYTSEGFSPNSVEVALGDTVIFSNQGDRDMWVASGVHPTHLLYPEFDQKALVKKGGAYEFTFQKVGKWPYHNHMNPTDFGFIIVK